MALQLLSGAALDALSICLPPAELELQEALYDGFASVQDGRRGDLLHRIGIPALRQVDTELGKLIAEQAVQIVNDRLTTRETLAELKTDVGYIRRYVEEERRGARQ